ncbi:MAG: DUF4157 domain-containing protein [Chitinophagaceae bacterium]|nr:DUF4157 domain-containing protein [Chitinophagaceae bacterium]MCW5915032.1 DUF4157 domain-containing protein [Chitinophagaceae bacterium]
MPYVRNNQKFFLKEQSWVARLAARRLKAANMAIVLGHTIHLWNVSCDTFLKNERWVRHELCHVRQFDEYGFFSFICKYLYQSIRYGYTNNKFEVEARRAESA